MSFARRSLLTLSRARPTASLLSAARPAPAIVPRRAFGNDYDFPVPSQSSTKTSSTPLPETHSIRDLGLMDEPTSTTPTIEDNSTDWSRSFHGLSAEPFSKEVLDVLAEPLNPEDVEIKPGVYTSRRWNRLC